MFPKLANYNTQLKRSTVSKLNRQRDKTISNTASRPQSTLLYYIYIKLSGSIGTDLSKWLAPYIVILFPLIEIKETIFVQRYSFYLVTLMQHRYNVCENDSIDYLRTHIHVKRNIPHGLIEDISQLIYETSKCWLNANVY